MVSLNPQPRPDSPPPDASSSADILKLEEILNSALRGWWLLALFALLGGLLGLGISSLRPTVYESGFTVLTSIDLTNTGEQTQFEEDLGMEAVGQLIGSTGVYARMAAQAQKEGITLDASSLLTMASLERRLGTWRMRLRDSDPRRAERIAAIWQSIVLADLSEAMQHASAADGLQRKQLSLEACLNQSAFNEPSAAQCSPLTLRALQSQLRAAARLIAEERTASHGLISAILVDTVPKPIIPAAAVLYQRGQMAAAGALIGLILAIWLLQSGLAARWLWGKRG
jgi:hypothetical protein